MEIKIIVFGLILFFQSSQGMAQEEAVDRQVDQFELSLERKADSLKGLTFDDKLEEIKHVRNIIRVYRDLNIDSALAFSNKELALAQDLGDMNELAMARLNAASMLIQLERDADSKNLLLKNRAERSEINDTLKALTESALSNVFINTGEYDKSILASLAAANAFEQLNDSTNAGFCYISLAEIYALVLDNHEEGIKHIEKAILFLSAHGAPKEYLIAALLTYGELSVIHEEYEVALPKYLQAEQIAIDNNDFWYYPDILVGLGKVYYFKKEYEKSIAYLQKAIEQSSVNDSKMIRASEYLGRNYMDLGKPAKAISHFKICVQNELTLQGRNRCREYLVQCYQQTSDYKKAFELQQEIIVSRDSINESKQKEKVTEIIEGYENEKKQLQIEQLRSENLQKENYITQQYFAILGIVVLFLLLGIGGYSWLRIRQKLKAGIGEMENAQLRQRFLRIQLNPHFLFHALSSIEGYIYTNQKEKAAAFLRNFSKLMRKILESSDREFIPLVDDIEMIQEYMILQQLNSEFKFDYSINVSDEQVVETLKIPPMLIQPFVENAILHGALNAKNGMVTLHVTLENDRLQIAINDNGPSSINNLRKSGALHRSMSIDIVKQRIRHLREIDGIEIHYSFSTASDGQEGTSVVLDIPLIYKQHFS